MKTSMYLNDIQAFIGGIRDLIWPRLCLLCETSLNEGESSICLECLYGLPALKWANYTDNRVCERFFGKIPFEKAAAAFRYDKDSHIHTLVEAFKYKGESELATKLGKLAGERLLKDGFFHDIDVLVPVPLHPERLRIRGYNQSERIAAGLSQVSGIPVNNSLLTRTKNNTSQTTRNTWKRWENSQTLFKSVHTNSGENKHLLLVDDVLTSGSTLESCATCLLSEPGLKISIFSLALAMH